MRFLQLPSVVELSVGGVLFTTRLCTLRRYPDSLLAAMFSGKYRLDHDEAYRVFIDRCVNYNDIATDSNLIAKQKRECSALELYILKRIKGRMAY